MSITSLCIIVLVASNNDNEIHLKNKLVEYIDTQYDGDYTAAFRSFSGADFKLSRYELNNVLKTIGIGTYMTRSIWVNGIIDILDIDRNNMLDYDELFRNIVS